MTADGSGSDPAVSDSAREALITMLMEDAATQEPRSAEDFLPLVANAAALHRETGTLLRSVVASARNAGATWQTIGATLHMTKQAAQKRFASSATPDGKDLDPDERILGPTNFVDEMRELALAGQYGWHSVERGLTYHRVVRSTTRWEHCTALSAKRIRLLEADGWHTFGRGFPYTYLKRDTGVAALREM